MGVSPFDKPEMETVAVPIPSLAWPLVWLVVTGWMLLADIADFTIDREADAAEALIMFPICVGFFLAALAYHRKRVRQREQWRDERFWEWMHKPLSPPLATDWEKFEYDVAKMVADQESPQRIGDIGAKGLYQGVYKNKRDKGGRVKRPGTSDHGRWIKYSTMQDDWR